MKKRMLWPVAVALIVALWGCGSSSSVTSAPNPFEGLGRVVFGYYSDRPNGWVEPKIGSDGKIAPTWTEIGVPGNAGRSTHYIGHVNGDLSPSGELFLVGELTQPSTLPYTHLRVKLKAQLTELPPADPNDVRIRYPTYGGKGTIETEGVEPGTPGLASHSIEFNYWNNNSIQ